MYFQQWPFPTSLYLFQKYFGSNIEKFEKYVICAKCGSLCCYKECFEINGHPRLCNHIQYRHHPYESHRVPYSQKLLKEIITQKERKYYPIKVIVTPQLQMVF